MNKIVSIIKDLNKVGVNPVKSNNALKWCKGNREACKNLFIEIFKAVDNTISDFQYLEEYDEIVDWMTDTKGKGLFPDVAGYSNNGFNLFMRISFYLQKCSFIKLHHRFTFKLSSHEAF